MVKILTCRLNPPKGRRREGDRGERGKEGERERSGEIGKETEGKSDKCSQN